MKKLISFLICLLLFVTLCITSYADSQVYTIPELDMTIEIPDYYAVYAEGFEKSEEELEVLFSDYAKFGVTREEVESYLASVGLCLDAIDVVSQNELAITVQESTQGDFAVLSDHILNPALQGFEDGIAELVEVTTHAMLFHCGQEKYIKMSYLIPLEHNQRYAVQYYTVRGGKAINFVFYSYDDAIGIEEELQFDKIVQSVSFQNEPRVPEGFDHSPSYVYQDEVAGVSFSVPMNWKEVVFNSDRQFLDAKFQSTEKSDLSIIYCSEDMYAALFQGQLGVWRDGIKDYYFSDEDIAMIMGCEKEAVERVTIADKKYYQVTVKQSLEDYGLPMNIETIYLIHFDKGYLIYFLFNGSSDDPYYEDFLSLVSSAEYPTKIGSFKMAKMLMPFRDFETGIHGNLPVDWNYQRDYDNVNSETEIYSKIDPSVSVLYSWIDCWSALSREDRIGHSRTKYTLDDLLESEYGSDLREYENKKLILLSSGEYLKVKIPGDGSAGETRLSHMQNGILFNFIYSGDDESAAYADFVKFLDALDYSEMDATAYMTLPEGIKFDMTPEQIHQIFGKDPNKVIDDSASEQLREYYDIDYDSRPAEFDAAGNLKDSVVQCSVSVNYGSPYDSLISDDVYYMVYLPLDYLYCQDVINSYVYEMNKLYGDCYEEDVEDGVLYYWDLEDREMGIDFGPVNDDLYGIVIYWIKFNNEVHTDYS